MPREICLSLGADVLKSGVGAEKIIETLHPNIAPDVYDSASRDMILFLGLRRSHLSLGEYLSRSQMAVRRVEARLPNGAISLKFFRPPSVSIMRVSRRTRNP